MKTVPFKAIKISLLVVCAFAFAMRFGDAGAQSQRQSQLWRMSAQDALSRSAGCLDCHRGIEDMHNGAINLGCVDCHGGDASARLSPELSKGSSGYEDAKRRAHVQPRFPEKWKSSANPERSYALLNRESSEFIRFINPGDLRVADISCGTSECHANDAHNVNRSMMKTGAMLWGAALYNNGSFPLKNYRFGESYNAEGISERIETIPAPTFEETLRKGILPFLDPLPRWEITQPGNILRAFERGGRKAPEVGLPIPDEIPGRPTQNQLSARGVGTLSRTDPVFLGLQKTRLMDPMLSFLGTNDQPGDYRSSGCTACHVVYANDRDPYHSGPYAQFGHNGFSGSGDPTIPKNESGHPIKHQLTRAIPSSQCVVCHMHPGTLVLNTYYGTTWWDLETDGGHMYPASSKKLSAEEVQKIQERNPEGSALRGLWGGKEFLENVSELNGKLKHTQFADFNGHGWIYRSVFKQDRKGNLLDANGKIINEVTSEKLQRAVKETTDNPAARDGVPVHLKDIHLEKGMHCVDCHFRQDNHGNGKLYGEVRNAIEIDCVDCHGTIDRRADPTSKDAKTSAAAGGNRMLDYRNVFPLDDQNRSPQFSQDRFFKKDGRLYQRSAVEQGKVWEVVQVKDSITPGDSHYNEKARLAKTILKDGKTWGAAPGDESKLAHANSNMTCYSCHLSWTPSCFGCHLKQTANQKRPMLHNEGEEELRNWTSYNFQTLRDDVFMLGRDGSVTGRRVAPVRSACAILVSSQNADREWLYSQQQTISAEGYSGQSFSSHFPHTVRTKETKGCTDCHLSANNDNNAYLAMALMQGTNFYNFLGRYVYVAQGGAGFEAVVVTERDEPQAVIGSELHRLAYPENFQKHQQRGQSLEESYRYSGGLASLGNSSQEVLSLQLRGEYLYAATGKGGVRIYDVANIDRKGFSQRVITAPVSALGQRLYVKTKYATAIASPSTLAIDPTRNHRPENQEAQNRDDKQPIPLVYAFLYATDKYEGLIVVGDPKTGVATLLDGDPTNNFLKRALTWNPDGILNGANNITIAGTRAYITCDRGLVIVDINNPLKPRVVGEIGQPYIKQPRAVQIQFRYAFVCDAEGVKVVDVTNPDQARPVAGAVVPLAEANNIYLVRTYAYVAAGKQGLAIVDIERPERPRLDQIFNAGGAINDARDVKVGMTNVSLFAYLADGVNGLRVIQLTSPEWTRGNYGFSPHPTPRLIATRRTRGPALAISEGLDRDRAVDESGNQLAVFGRRGARPFNLAETRRMFAGDNGELFTVHEIKDERDIRAFYGPPAGKDVAQSKLIGIGLLLLPFGIILLLRRNRHGRRPR
ncbi:MAG: hypothetical protein JMDDDDMK_01692 [Acidobacteria bacterium]|nr:hypothetical protein [Acidobacteriota bacterium]